MNRAHFSLLKAIKQKGLNEFCNSFNCTTKKLEPTKKEAVAALGLVGNSHPTILGHTGFEHLQRTINSVNT